MPRNKDQKYIPNLRVNKGIIRARNFSGKATPYTPEGDRTFLLMLNDEEADRLTNDGWNVKWFEPREEGDKRQAFLKVKVVFKKYPPEIWMVYPKVKRELNEETVHLLDTAEIEYIDALITPYSWSLGGKSGVAAYLKIMYAIIREDELESRYRNVPDTVKDEQFYGIED